VAATTLESEFGFIGTASNFRRHLRTAYAARLVAKVGTLGQLSESARKLTA
jgi:hypothetical protein